MNSAGSPVEDATVEIWQANAEGRYNHPHDPNPAPRDQDFQGWAIVPSGMARWFFVSTRSCRVAILPELAGNAHLISISR